MRVLLLTVAAMSVVSCLSPQKREQRERAELSRRIDVICRLPAAERDAALERLRKESGLVLVCGN